MLQKKGSEDSLISPPSQLSPVEIHENPFLFHLQHILADPTFQSFRKSYLTTWSDMETICFYLFIYDYVTYEYKKRFDKPLSSTQAVCVIHTIMSNNEFRRYCMGLFQLYKKHECTVAQLETIPEINQIQPCLKAVKKRKDNSTILCVIGSTPPEKKKESSKIHRLPSELFTFSPSTVPTR